MTGFDWDLSHGPAGTLPYQEAWPCRQNMWPRAVGTCFVVYPANYIPADCQPKVFREVMGRDREGE